MTFIFDENLSRRIPQALDILQQRINKSRGIHHRVEHITQTFPAGTKDPDFLSQFPKSAVLITLDINQQRKWHEKILIDKQQVNVIYFRSKQSLNFWQQVLLFVNSWQSILHNVDTIPKPLLIRYKPGEVRRFIREI